MSVILQKNPTVYNVMVGTVLALSLFQLFDCARGNGITAQHRPLLQSNATMVSTCRFENKLVIISDTIDKLYIQLAEIRTKLDKPDKHNVSEAKKSLEQFRQALNETYRPHVNSLLKEKNDTENDLDYIIRYRREIHESLSPLVSTTTDNPESTPFSNSESETDEDEEDSNSSETHLANMTDFIVNSNFTFEGEWRKIILNCLYHYQVLTRIIQFENFIQREMPMFRMINIDSEANHGWFGPTAARRWQCLKLFLSRWLSFICEMMRCLSKRILSNNLYLVVLMLPFFALILFALLYKSTSRSERHLPITIVTSQTRHQRKPRASQLTDYDYGNSNRT